MNNLASSRKTEAAPIAEIVQLHYSFNDVFPLREMQTPNFNREHLKL